MYSPFFQPSPVHPCPPALNADDLVPPLAFDRDLGAKLACGRQWGYRQPPFTDFGTRQAIGFAVADPSLRNATQRWLEFTRRSLVEGIDASVRSSQNYIYSGVQQLSCPSATCSAFTECDAVSVRVGAQCVPAGAPGTCAVGQVLSASPNTIAY